MLGLVYVMQASTVVPMTVVWWRRKHFSPPIKLLSWYVYLSLASSAGAYLLYPAYLPTNYCFIVGFNLGKTVLFGAVYYQVLTLASTRRMVLWLTLAGIAMVVGVIGFSFSISLVAASVSRVTQCALLAGFALLYLEQTLNGPATRRPTHDPLWLLSVGQLLYSAGTVTAFSTDLMPASEFNFYVKFSFVSVSGLVFNYFLTLAFLRAKPGNATVLTAANENTAAAGKLARF